MSDIIAISIFVISAALLLYWFWPGTAHCVKCEAELDEFGYCTNLACTYAARQQPFEKETSV